jgi:hypothetical protein
MFFKGTQYVIHDNEKKYGLKRITTKNLTNLNNYIILNDQIWNLFRKSLSWSFFVGLIFSPPQHLCKELFRWANFLMDFIN